MKKQILLTILLIATAFEVNGASIRDLLRQRTCPMPTNNGSFLDLRNQDIDSLDGFKNIPGIKNVIVINLQNNRITNIGNHFKNLSNLDMLFIDDNYIESIDNCFDGCTNLTCISINNNLLKTLNIENIIQLRILQYLSLDNNYLNLDEESIQILKSKVSSFIYGTQQTPFVFAD